MTVPDELHTSQLLLRSWRADDAAALLPVLEANQAHLSPWIPVHVWSPAPIPELETRLATFAADFTSARAWRYGLFMQHDNVLVGEIALFPRSADGRVPYDEADRVEIGYWLRSDFTGHGLVTEAARRVVDVARALPGILSVEIRCDALNVPSAAIPRRLGFVLDSVGVPSLTSTTLQVWTYPLGESHGQSA